MGKSSRPKKIKFGVLVSTLICLEIYCAQLSYENYGWWMPIGLYILIFFNCIPIVLFIKSSQISAIILLTILAIFIIPNQIILAHKYQLEQEEGANIVSYVYRQKELTGEFL